MSPRGRSAWASKRWSIGEDPATVATATFALPFDGTSDPGEFRLLKLGPLLAVGIAVSLILPATATAFTAAKPSLPLRALGSTGDRSVPSTNWAGYAARGPFHAFRNVSARWVQPRAVCASLSTYSAFWVGLDGFGSGTVEQVGTSSDCSRGRPVYYAWYEMYPRLPSFLPVPIHPGDRVVASVTHTRSGRFALYLRNLTTGRHAITMQDMPYARASSAEVIAEAPLTSSRRSVLPLANFRQVSFADAIVNGRGIAAFHPTRLTMVVNRSTVKARASEVVRGSGFSVTWNHR